MYLSVDSFVNWSFTFFWEAGDVLSKLLEIPALQVDWQLEEGDSLRAADWPRAGHHPAGRLNLLQELRKHCRGGKTQKINTSRWFWVNITLE